MSLENLTGRTLGEFHLKKLIGKGGMGTVYLADQPSLHREVAVKVLPPMQTGSAEERERFTEYTRRFEREARTAAKLEHPYIVPIYAYGAESNIIYVAMRFLTGGSLADRLIDRRRRELPPMPLLEISDLLTKIASALDYAHHQHVVHRDIKPSNIMFDNTGNPFLVDFGIVKVLRESPDAGTLTKTDGIIGTPAYMSPEQWQASRDLTGASDQYALAVVVYEMVAGHPPFEAPTASGYMYKHLFEAPPPPHVTRGDIPPQISDVLARALAKDPAHRFPAIGAFAAAFTQAAKTLPPIPTRPDVLPERMPTVTIRETPPAPGYTPPPVPPTYAALQPTIPAADLRTPMGYPPATSTPPYAPYPPSYPQTPPPRYAPPPKAWYQNMGVWVGIFAVVAVVGAVIIGLAIIVGGDGSDDTPSDTPEPVISGRPTLQANEAGYILSNNQWLPFGTNILLNAGGQTQLIAVNANAGQSADGYIYALPGSQLIVNNAIGNRFSLTLRDNSDIFIQTGGYRDGAEVVLESAVGYQFTVSGSCLAASQYSPLVSVGCYSGNCAYRTPTRNLTSFREREQLIISTQTGDLQILPISPNDAERYRQALESSDIGRNDAARCVLPVMQNPLQPTNAPTLTPTDEPRPATPTVAPTFTLFPTFTSAPTLTPTATASPTPADSDGDTIIDAMDACPNEPGDGSLSGCPDDDQDGVRFSQDQCPFEFGTAENNGCP